MALKLATVNLTWDPVSGSSGYDILVDGTKVSNAGPNAKTTKVFVAEGAKHVIGVKAQPSGQLFEARFEWSRIVADPPHSASQSVSDPTPVVAA